MFGAILKTTNIYFKQGVSEITRNFRFALSKFNHLYSVFDEMPYFETAEWWSDN